MKLSGGGGAGLQPDNAPNAARTAQSPAAKTGIRLGLERPGVFMVIVAILHKLKNGFSL